MPASGIAACRLGAPHDLLARLAKGELPPLDAALTIAEGWGGREREAWAPVLLAMAKIPTLGSDATTLSVSLDKSWARALVAAAGVPVPRAGGDAVGGGSAARRRSRPPFRSS